MSSFLGGFSVFRKEIARFMRVWSQTIASPIISSSLYLLVFGVSLASVLREQGGVSYLEFLVPGLVAMSALNNSLQNSASSIMISKYHNDLQDMRIIPVSNIALVMAYSLAGLVRGLLCSILVFGVGQLFVYFQLGHFLVPHSLSGALGFLILGSLFFGYMGIWAGFIAKSFDHIGAISQFIVLPLIYLGGVFFSLETLHPFWQKVAQVNPLVYIINGIRWSLLGVSDIPASRAFLACFFFVLISGFLAYRGVSRGNYVRF